VAANAKSMAMFHPAGMRSIAILGTWTSRDARLRCEVMVAQRMNSNVAAMNLNATQVFIFAPS
jgi:hypothetical protein